MKAELRSGAWFHKKALSLYGKKSFAEAAPQVDRACELGTLMACGKGMSKDYKRARELNLQGCNLARELSQ